MSEITLVTAYFDVGQKDWTGFNRDNARYLNYFRHWARMRNRLIVYTSPDQADAVFAVRKEFGLADRTTVISIPDVLKIAPDVYQAIRQTMRNRESWLFHRCLNTPESWSYKYNYITGLKTYWVQDAVKRGLAGGMTAWIDFGYDHSGDYFPYDEDFDFLWDYDFSPRIHLFLKHDMDDMPIFRIVQNMTVYVRGNLMVGPAELWPAVWKDARQSILTLAECGLADDDQLIMVMAYRRHPELYQTHVMAFWGEALYRFGGSALRLAPLKTKKMEWMHVLHRRYKSWRRRKWAALKMKRDVRKRMGREIEKKYYPLPPEDSLRK